MTRKRKKLLQDQQEFVKTVVKDKKKRLYKEYLEQTVSEHDLWSWRFFLATFLLSFIHIILTEIKCDVNYEKEAAALTASFFMI